MKFKRLKGLTLIEAIIVTLLFSIVLASLFTILRAVNISWESGGSQLSVQQEARRAINAMAKELRQARTLTIAGTPADGTNHSTIIFNIPETISESGVTWSSNIQYALGGLNNAQLIRTQNGGQRVMANYISALSFSRDPSAIDVINISITAQKNTFSGFGTSQSDITLNSEIKVRN